MSKNVKKISALFLLLVTAMPLLFTIILLARQKIAQYDMKERLEKELLHTIVVPKKKIIWVKYNKEIRLGDKLFDIKSSAEKNGNIYFTGLFDEEEAALNNIMQKNTEEKNGNDLANLIHWLQSPCINPISTTEIITDCEIDYSTPILLDISSPFINILTPPPQKFLI
jgi:hypothetical protein